MQTAPNHCASQQRYYGRACCLVSILLVRGLALGQAVSAGPAAPEDKAIELTPFEVRAEKDTGYIGLNAASGSRLNSPVRDTPASISIFTAEFLQDIGATSVDDLSKYATNTESDVGFVSALPNGNSLMNPTSGITARGLPTSGGSASGRTVNFFSYNFEIDTYNIDRVEFSRGPNAILFGIGQAGGSFNTMSRTADLKRPIYGATLRVGSYDALRGTLDFNQPLIKDRLALRFDAVADHKLGWRPWEFGNNKRVYLALRYQVTARTTVDVQSETATYDFRRPRPYLGPNHVSAWLAAGRPTSPNPFTSSTPSAQGLRRVSSSNWWVYINGDPVTTFRNFFNMGRTANPVNDSTKTPMIQDFSLVPKRAVLAGPGPGNNARFSNHSGFLRHEFSRVFFSELAVTRQIYHSKQRDINGPDMTLYFDPNQNLYNLPAGGPTSIPNPNVGKPYLENYMQQRSQTDRRDAARLTAAYNLDLGRVFGRHQLAGMGERWEQKSWATTFVESRVATPTAPNAPEDSTNYLMRRTYVDLGGPVENISLRDFRLTPLPGIDFVPKATPSYNRYYQNAWMAATQSKFWQERIVFTLGMRHDYLYSKLSTGVRSAERVGGYTQGFLMPGAANTSHAEGSTRTQGVVLHATPWLSLIANHSTNFALPALNQKTLPNNPVAQPRGETHDFGVQLNLLQDRLSARVIYYETAVKDNTASVSTGNIQDRVNNIWNRLATIGFIPMARRDTELVSCNAYNFDNSSQGWEGEIVANLTPSWRLMANLSTNQTSWTNVATAIRAYIEANRAFWVSSRDATVLDYLLQTDNYVGPRYEFVEGTLLQLSPKWSGNCRTNYSFRESALKGVSLGAGSRWKQGTLLGYTSTDPATRQAIRSGSNVLVDANVGYRRKLTLFNRGISWSLQLNANNLLDNDKILPQTTDPTGAILNYRFQAPREWLLTSSFNF